MIVKMSNMLLSALISDPCVVKNDFDLFCNLCIAVMTVLANNWGVTYGTANVVLFVILMPLIIGLFFVAALFKREKYRPVRLKLSNTPVRAKALKLLIYKAFAIRVSC